jgi:hypothetical protein
MNTGTAGCPRDIRPLARGRRRRDGLGRRKVERGTRVLLARHRLGGKVHRCRHRPRRRRGNNCMGGICAGGCHGAGCRARAAGAVAGDWQALCPCLRRVPGLPCSSTLTQQAAAADGYADRMRIIRTQCMQNFPAGTRHLPKGNSSLCLSVPCIAQPRPGQPLDVHQRGDPGRQAGALRTCRSGGAAVYDTPRHLPFVHSATLSPTRQQGHAFAALPEATTIQMRIRRINNSPRSPSSSLQ